LGRREADVGTSRHNNAPTVGLLRHPIRLEPPWRANHSRAVTPGYGRPASGWLSTEASDPLIVFCAVLAVRSTSYDNLSDQASSQHLLHGGAPRGARDSSWILIRAWAISANAGTDNFGAVARLRATGQTPSNRRTEVRTGLDGTRNCPPKGGPREHEARPYRSVQTPKGPPHPALVAGGGPFMGMDTPSPTRRRSNQHAGQIGGMWPNLLQDQPAGRSRDIERRPDTRIVSLEQRRSVAKEVRRYRQALKR